MPGIEASGDKRHHSHKTKTAHGGCCPGGIRAPPCRTVVALHSETSSAQQEDDNQVRELWSGPSRWGFDRLSPLVARGGMPFGLPDRVREFPPEFLGRKIKITHGK